MRYSTTQSKLIEADKLATYFDYTNQAWVVNGVYVGCSHKFACQCFGKLHAGELASTFTS